MPRSRQASKLIFTIGNPVFVYLLCSKKLTLLEFWLEMRDLPPSLLLFRLLSLLRPFKEVCRHNSRHFKKCQYPNYISLLIFCVCYYFNRFSFIFKTTIFCFFCVHLTHIQCFLTFFALRTP